MGYFRTDFRPLRYQRNIPWFHLRRLMCTFEPLVTNIGKLGLVILCLQLLNLQHHLEDLLHSQNLHKQVPYIYYKNKYE